MHNILISNYRIVFGMLDKPFLVSETHWKHLKTILALGAETLSILVKSFIKNV